MQQYFNCILFVYIVYIAHPHKGCLDPLTPLPALPPPPILTLTQSSTYIKMIHTNLLPF